MLSCSCSTSDCDWYYLPPMDFGIFNRKRRKRCCSCNKLIDIGSDCLEFERFRAPVSDIEERICGDEIFLAPNYMCESCGEIFLNLSDIGYCIYLGDDMRKNLEDYWNITGFRQS